MKSHIMLWSVTLGIVLMASAVFMARTQRSDSPVGTESVDALVARAITLLEDDGNMLHQETRSAIRMAAAIVEAGSVTTAQEALVLALQYKNEQNFQGAEASFKHAIALDPNWSWSYAELGNLLGRNSYNRTDEAMDDLRKAVALDPEWGRPYNIMAVILRAQGRYEEARVEAEKALKIMPDDISPLNNYANLLVDLERYDEAEIYFRKAIERSPDHPKPYYNLACLYSLRGRTRESLDYLREAFQRSDLFRLEAMNDPDLAGIKDNPEFKALVEREPVTPS